MGLKSISIVLTWQISLFILLIIMLQILCDVGGLVKYVAFSEVVFPQLNSTKDMDQKEAIIISIFSFIIPQPYCTVCTSGIFHNFFINYISEIILHKLL